MQVCFELTMPLCVHCCRLKGQILSLPSLGGGKDMVIVFARSKSDAIAKADGTFEVCLAFPTLPCPDAPRPPSRPFCNVKALKLSACQSLRRPRDAGEGV